MLSHRPLVGLTKGFINLVDFLEEPAPGFIDSLYGSLCFYLVDFSPGFDYFLMSTPLWCICFFLFERFQVCCATVCSLLFEGTLTGLG